MADAITKIIEQKEKQLAELLEDFEAVSNAQGREINVGAQKKLERQARDLQNKILSLEKEIKRLKSELQNDASTPYVPSISALSSPDPTTPETDIDSDSPAPELNPISPTAPSTPSSGPEKQNQTESDHDLPADSHFTPPEDNSSHTDVVDWIWDLIKHWLWVQFLAWIVLIIGVISGFNEIFDIPPCIRLGITTIGVLLGGGIIIGVSFHHKQRDNYHRRDRILTALLLVVATAVLMSFTIHRCTSIPPLPDPTPNPTLPATLTADITETATSPVCSTPHPPLPGSSISGSISVTYVPIPVMSDCLEIKGQLPTFQVSWKDVPVGTELWVLVYSPLAQLYFPHYCTSIPYPTGGQECRVTLLEEEPYDIVFVLADATAHGVLKATSSLPPSGIPSGLAEKFTIQVSRTE
jgi:hypothetical protein